MDAQGRAIYAHDRTAPIQLNNEDRVTFRYGTDGTRLVVETSTALVGFDAATSLAACDEQQPVRSTAQPEEPASVCR